MFAIPAKVEPDFDNPVPPGRAKPAEQPRHAAEGPAHFLYWQKLEV